MQIQLLICGQLENIKAEESKEAIVSCEDKVRTYFELLSNEEYEKVIVAGKTLTYVVCVQKIVLFCRQGFPDENTSK